jgi:hypothetical protein
VQSDFNHRKCNIYNGPFDCDYELPEAQDDEREPAETEVDRSAVIGNDAVNVRHRKP